MSNDLNHANLAELFDELAQTCIAISGTFRAATDNGDAASGKPPAGKRLAAGSGKGLAKKAVAEEVTEDALDIDTVRDKRKELASAKGKDAMVEALEHVGAIKLGDVDEDSYQELFDKAQELLDATEEEAEEEPPAKKPAAAKKAAVKKPAAPTLKDVKAAAAALKEAADAKTYKATVKAVGDLDELEKDDYQDAIDQFVGAMPEEE